MIAQLAPIQRCQEIAGLAAHEIMLGVAPGRKHERLLARYRGMRRSLAVSRVRVVADIRAAMIRGATGEAADLLIVLRRMLAPEALTVHPACARRITKRLTFARGRVVALASLSPEGDSVSKFDARPPETEDAALVIPLSKHRDR